ncbi:MAG: recombinase family protein [Solirubrobacteraceae bacterium]
MIYAAKSTIDPRGSIGRQIEDCHALAERNGWSVVAEYSDEAASAYRGNRGDGLARAKAHAESIGGNLVVQHADRLARGDGVRADHLVELALWARKAGVTITSVQDPMTFEGGLAFAAMMGDRNYEDSRRKAEAVKSGKAGQLARGKALGRLHDGYRLVPDPEGDGKVRVIDPERSIIVLRVFDLIEAGHTPGEVSRLLNGEGIRTARGHIWRARAVRDLVTNPFYAAYAFRRDAKGQPFDLTDATHEALIDRDRWRRVQLQVTRMDPAAVQKRKGGRTGTVPYLLRSIVFCTCGAPMYTSQRTNKNGTVTRGYWCRDARQATGVCRTRWINAEFAEGAVLLHLETFIDGVDEWLAELADSRRGEHAILEKAAGAARRRADDAQVDRDKVAAQWRRWTELGDERKADLILSQLERADNECRALAAEVERAEARASEWRPDRQDLDGALDLYNELAALVRGKVAAAAAADELNVALRNTLERVTMNLSPPGQLVADFRLRASAAGGAGGMVQAVLDTTAAVPENAESNPDGSPS